MTRPRTQYYTAATLDGYIADPSHSLDWLFQFGDAGSDDVIEFMEQVGTVAMGANTYEWILRHQTSAEGGAPAPWPYTQPAWIFATRPLAPVAGADIRFVRGDVRPVHQEMAAAGNGGNIWIVGGGNLAGQFLDHGLLDEMIVTIAPVTLGAGTPLLPRVVSRPPLRLVGIRQFEAGLVQLRYEVPRPPTGDDRAS